MKTIITGGAAAAAALLAFGAGGDRSAPEPAPFVDPSLLVRSACGATPDAARARRAPFFILAAAMANEPAPMTKERFSPTPGIGYPVTANAAAQALFDAGLAHVWNFNHAEGIAAFRAAQDADPGCAMCFWAEAFALGPNINAPMADDAVGPAYAAARRALALKDGASEKERVLIDALATRYPSAPVKDRAPFDAAFADAMEAAAARFPDDDFILALAAEANMDAEPWDYWNADGRTPKGRAARTMTLIETVLARNPNHAAAIHLYIHMTEASDNPYRALKPADRLAKLSPGLGHLIHMPSHTYYRIGEFRRSIETNIDAVSADEAFIASGQAGPLYEYGYYVHNVHMLLTSAMMAGDRATSLAMADKLDAKLPLEMSLAEPIAQPIKAAPIYARVMWETPETLLAIPDPGEAAPFLRAVRHYARGVALAAKGEAAAAAAEAAAIETIRSQADFSALEAYHVPAQDILAIAKLTVEARALEAAGDLAGAIRVMEEAVAAQDRIAYTEPPYWYYPSRQTLAAMVLRSGDAERAEQLFLEALVASPNNGWVLAGLAETYGAQGDKSARKYAQGLFRKAWSGGKAAPALERL